MKVAIISPIPNLTSYAGESDVHLTLVQHMASHRYREYYLDRSMHDYVIIDNGADELKTGLDVRHVLHWAQTIRAQEIVLPDVQQSKDETYEATWEACRWLITPEGREAYARANTPRLMIVPQGRNLDEWLLCLDALLNMRVYQGIVWNGDWPPVIGIAKNHDALIPGGIPELLDAFGDRWGPRWDLHMLGWPKRLAAVEEALQVYPRLRSIDTARPLVYARAGIEIVPGDPAPAYPGRDHMFIDVAIPSEYHRLALSNVNAFKIMAKDTDDARLRA